MGDAYSGPSQAVWRALMNLDTNWLYSLVLPFGGWIVSVERRLAVLLSMKDTVEKIEKKQDRLVDYLIDGPEKS